MTIDHSLHPCPTCSRHVRASESRCPFCGETLELDASPALLPAARLGRAGILGFQSLVRAGLVAVTSSAIAACTETSAVPMYGAPSPGTGGTFAGGASGSGGTTAGTGTSGGTAGSNATGGGPADAGEGGQSGEGGSG